MTSKGGNTASNHGNSATPRRDAYRYDGDIVISGISGRYPESPDIDELWKNLVDKKDMITSNESVFRFPEGFHGIGDFGKIKDAEKFDCEFFRMSPDCANWMSNETRLCMEMSYEAIVDSGQSLESVAGSNTGTYFAHGRSVDAMWAYTKGLEDISPNSFMGLSHCMLANRVAHYFDLQGPSVIMDNACSSSLATLDAAVESIRNGSVDAALVGGACFIFSPNYLIEAIAAGVFSVDRRCKSFDSRANGYVRGEAAGAIFLQKKSDAKRSYATVVQTGSGHDGHTATGFGATSFHAQNKLMKSVYDKAGVNPKDVSYIETHGTGTQVGDTNEIKSFETDDFFFKDRQGPLLVGSVKSNLGHAEYVSGLVSLSKVVLLMHHNSIPPNLHFESPNPKIQSIVDGRTKVVTESTPYNGGPVAINSFGIGGSLVHALLAPPETKKKSFSPAGKAPRLFTYSGRCEEGLQEVLDFAKRNDKIIEVQQLMSSSTNMAPSLMPYRGFTVLNCPTDLVEIQKSRGQRPPVWFIFPGLGCQWMGMGLDLLTIPLARESMERTCNFFYQTTGYDMMEFFTGGPKAQQIYDQIPMPLVTVIQVALIDILKAVGIEPDGIVGHSNGEVAAAYADGCITGEEAVFMAYVKTGMRQFAKDIIREDGRMAAIGLSWAECEKRLPSGVYVVCNNSAESVTVSGKAKLVEDFAATIKAEGHLAKVLPSFGMAFHSPDMALFINRQKEMSKNILKSKKLRSSRWISTCYREDEWGCEGARYGDEDYFLHNSISPVYFHEAVQKIPKDAVIVEIGPHSLFASMVRKTLGPEATAITMMKRDVNDSVGLVLAAIGKCYLNGLDVQPLNLHPPASFPVPSDTPFISPVIAKSWDHSQDFSIPHYTDFVEANKSNEYKVSLATGSEFEFLDDYRVGDEIYFPVSGYVFLTWKIFAKQLGVEMSSLPVKIQGDYFNTSITVAEQGEISFEVNIFDTTGKFQITCGDAVVAEGKIEKATSEDTSRLGDYTLVENETAINLDETKKELSKTDICTLQRVKGYRHCGTFEGIARASLDRTRFVIEWNDKWIPYLDCMLQACDLAQGNKEISKAASFDVTIDPTKMVSDSTEVKYSKMNVSKNQLSAATCGVKINNVTFNAVCRDPLINGTNNEQRFFSFLENSSSTSSPEVSAYEKVCHALSTKVLNLAKTASIKQNGAQKVNTSGSVLMNGGANNDKITDRHGLENLLNRYVTSNEKNIPDDGKMYDLDLLRDDMLLTNLCTVEMMKSCLDVVADNSIPYSTISILDVGDQSDADFNAIKTFMKHEPCIEYTYSACKGSILPGTLAGNKRLSTSTVNWSLGEMPLPSEQYSLIISSNILHMQPDADKSLQQMTSMLNPEGFMMIREITQTSPIRDALNIIKASKGQSNAATGNGKYKSTEEWRNHFSRNGLQVIMEKADNLSTMFFLKKTNVQQKEPFIIYVDDLKFGWVDKIKSVLPERDGTGADNKIWLVGTDQISGVVGMTRCLLKERLVKNIRCVLVSNLNPESTVPDLSRNGATFKKLLAQDLTINVHRDGSWGSLYRMPVNLEKKIEKSDQACLCQGQWGDMSSLSWVPDHMTTDESRKHSMMTSYCVGLNAGDVKFTDGEVSAHDLGLTSNILGFEAAGKLTNGRRVMIASPSSCRTKLDASVTLCLDVPDTWKLEEAATVPLAYSTAVYALVVKAHARKGDRVLINHGVSNVGQAARHLAISLGCEVFTAVENEAQKKELLKRFHGIRESHLALHSELYPGGKYDKAMDVILNLNPTDSVHDLTAMVGAYGRFVDVETVPRQRRYKVDLSSLPREATYHTANMYQLLKDTSALATSIKQQVQGHMTTFIKAQAVVPLPYNAFESDKIVEAIESLRDAKDERKVVIKLQEDGGKAASIPRESTVLAQNRTMFKPTHSYVVMGGLGGFGMEMVRWMVRRGCRKLVISSRSGIKTGLQQYVVDSLREQGATVVISKHNAVVLAEAEALLEEANKMGPLGGIFNLSLVLLDKTMKRQTVDLFNAVCDPKIQATINFDKLTRGKYRDSLDMFVVFSTVSSAHGCMGQANYGFANSCLERICEKRKYDNLPGLAIQWGIIGDVGVIARHTRHAGKLKGFVEMFTVQNIASCLKDMDDLLLQRVPVVTSFKKAIDETEEEEGDDGVKDSVLTAVGNLIGLRNTDTLGDNVALRDLGMDSFSTSEVKELLNKKYGLSLSDNDVRDLSVGKLKSLAR